MKRILFVLCLAACCLSPLLADQPTPTTPEPEAAIAFPAQPDFATTDVGDPSSTGSGCPAKVSCPGGITLSCNGITCTEVANQCVACTHSKGVIRQFCPGVSGSTCGGTVVENEGATGSE